MMIKPPRNLKLNIIFIFDVWIVGEDREACFVWRNRIKTYNWRVLQGNTEGDSQKVWYSDRVQGIVVFGVSGIHLCEGVKISRTPMWKDAHSKVH
ncbi:MAG: hypothetical protein ACEPOZ_21370 [Marinifilaceae bacterium]